MSINIFSSKVKIRVEDFKLPFLHFIPKFHKNPTDFRYIAAGVKSSLKTLSKILSGALKLVSSHFDKHCKYKFKFKNTSGYWIVKNKDNTINNLEYLNRTSTARNIKSFDFKKLYTNLPHDKVIDKVRGLIKLAFQDREMAFINISDKFNASWSNKGSGKWAFSADQLTEMLTFLMDNIYVTCGNRIYRQVIGIPMGCDCAPNVADMFLFAYEYDYVCTRTDLENDTQAFILKHCSRYIDDLNLPNADDAVISSIIEDIYPSNLDIIDTNDRNNNVSTFLDLEIFIENGRFNTRLYDKRRDFSFSVISLPNLRSNVPNKQSLGVFIGEVYRICKSSSRVEDFISEVKLLIQKLVKQNFKRRDLLSKLNRILKSRPACLKKYWMVFNLNMFQ